MREWERILQRERHVRSFERLLPDDGRVAGMIGSKRFNITTSWLLFDGWAKLGSWVGFPQAPKEVSTSQFILLEANFVLELSSEIWLETTLESLCQYWLCVYSGFTHWWNLSLILFLVFTAIICYSCTWFFKFCMALSLVILIQFPSSKCI